MILRCVICKSDIGRFEIRDIRKPLQGNMFTKLKESFPDPFNPVVEWAHMYCPYCNKRPFAKEDEICTPSGVITIDLAKKVRAGELSSIKAKKDLADGKLVVGFQKDKGIEKTFVKEKPALKQKAPVVPTQPTVPGKPTRAKADTAAGKSKKTTADKKAPAKTEVK